MTVIMQTVWTTQWMSLDGIEKEKGTSMSAGRLYDKIGDKAKGKIVFMIDNGAVCRITDDGIKEKDDVVKREK